MKLQLWRNATLLLNIDGIKILIDPMLGRKGSLGTIPMTDSEVLNPLVDLPFSPEELVEKLTEIDAVAITHLHSDHWDNTAIELLNKKTQIICPEAIADQIAQYGFENIVSIKDRIRWRNIDISITKGRHGTGEVGEKMGLVNGFVFTHSNETVYIVGDSIWCDEIAYEIDQHKPQHIIVAGGAATFSVGEPIIMTSEDIISTCNYTPKSTIWVTHLEAVSHCKEDRDYIQKKINENHVEERCFILKDGEEVFLAFD